MSYNYDDFFVKMSDEQREFIKQTLTGRTPECIEEKNKIHRVLKMLGCSSVDELLMKVLDGQIGYIPDYLKEPLLHQNLTDSLDPKPNLRIAHKVAWWKFVDGRHRHKI